MSLTNKKLIRDINSAYLKGDTGFVSAHLTEDMCWNIVGMPVIIGKNEFLKAVKTLELENFPSISAKSIISEGEYVVVESSGRDTTNRTASSYRAYCDIYLIQKGKIKELTTYVVDTAFSS
ncbi:MAG: nuclear transport factor 2 family protein [Melioribacteraceae bacterium]